MHAYTYIYMYVFSYTDPVTMHVHAFLDYNMIVENGFDII